MTENLDEQAVSRRNFMRNLGISLLAATTVGTGAAMITRETQKTPAAPPVIRELPSLPTSIPAVQSAQTVITANNDAAELLQKLAASQAENMRLQAALEAAQRDLDALSLTNNSNRSATEELSLQLASANDQIGVLGGLVALYEQLDDVDVLDTIQNGMAAVSESIDGLIEHTPTLSEGIQLGQQALADVEAHLPVLENGRAWMDAQVSKLNSFYETVEVVLQSVLETVGNFLDMVEAWFTNVRKWLPFGIGEKAANVVDSLSRLVAETPLTVEGLNTYLAQPLDHWLVREEGEPKLQRNLVKPVREKVLVRAQESINKAQQVQNSYQENLALPVELTFSNRQLIRGQIADYRQQHQV